MNIPPFLPFLRMMGMLQQPQMQEQEEPEIDFQQRMNQLYQPNNQASQAFLGELANFPQRQEPGMLQRIGAAMGGLGAGVQPETVVGGQPIGFRGNPMLAAQTQDYLKYQPYYTRAQDSIERLKTLEPALRSEKEHNTIQRQLATETIRREQDERRLRETERKNRAQEANQARRTEIAAARAATYNFKANNPGWKIVAPKGGFVIAYNPLNPTESTTVTGPDGQPIHTGTWTDEDRLQFERETATQIVEKRGEQARETQAAGAETKAEQAWSQPYQVTLPDGSIEYHQYNNVLNQTRLAPTPEGSRMERIGTSKGGDSTPDMLPTQRKVDIYNRAFQIQQSDPELAPYILLEPGNMVRILPIEAWRWSSAEKKKEMEEKRERLRQLLFGDSSSPTQRPNLSLAAPRGSTQVRMSKSGKPLVASDGRILMRDPYGREVYVPENQVGIAESKGGKVVIEGQ